MQFVYKTNVLNAIPAVNNVVQTKYNVCNMNYTITKSINSDFDCKFSAFQIQPNKNIVFNFADCMSTCIKF